MGAHPIFESDFDCLTEMDASEILSAAVEGIEKSDMKYDPETGRYFDPDLNLFYNPNDRSYFDKRSGKYYRRNDKGELIETYQDPTFIPPPPPDSDKEDETDEQRQAPTEEEKAQIEQNQIVDPSSFIDFSSLEPPPPPPPEDDDAQLKDQEHEEPVYHGNNVSAMIMSSDTIQLGQLNIITELGCMIGTANDCQIRVQEENVRPSNVVIQHKTEASLEPNPASYFQITFNSFALYNGQLKPAEHTERVSHMDRLQLGSTIIILHMHEPGETCDACKSGQIISELPETLQMGILTGPEQKEFLEKSEAERIREFYNFDRYCWGPGMCKAAQEQLAKREEKKIAKQLEISANKLNQTEEEKAQKHAAAFRRGNKGFSVAEDPVALAWYDDKTGQGEIGPEKPWQQRRVVRSNRKRQKLSSYERSELKYEQKDEKRVWY